MTISITDVVSNLQCSLVLLTANTLMLSQTYRSLSVKVSLSPLKCNHVTIPTVMFMAHWHATILLFPQELCGTLVGNCVSI